MIDMLDRKGTHRVLAAPAVRHLAKKHNIDITQIVGTGKDGRVRKEDILNVLKLRAAQVSVPPTPPPSPPPHYYPTSQPVHVSSERPVSTTTPSAPPTPPPSPPPPTSILRPPLREDKVTFLILKSIIFI